MGAPLAAAAADGAVDAAAATTTATPQQKPDELVVVTLNTWGLGMGLAKQREARMDALCDWLADPLRHQRPPAPPAADATTPRPPFAVEFWRDRPIDLVLLQEVWVSSDAARLAAAAKRGGLPHSVHFCSGAFGAGLVTLSRFPVDAARLHIFSARGDPCAIFSGDFFAAKGVGWCRVRVPGSEQPLHVFNTHLCSNYRHTFRPLPLLPQEEAGGVEALTEQRQQRRQEQQQRPGRRVSMAIECGDSGVRVPTDADAATRLAQVLELCDFVQEVSGLRGSGNGAGAGDDHGATATGPPALVVLGGDLNSEPDTLEVALLKARLPELADAWVETADWRAEAFGNGADANAADATSAAAGHTCRSALCSYKPRRQVPERIDYVWSTLAPQAAALDLARVPGGGGHSFSDHLAVRAALGLSGERAAASKAAATAAAASAATNTSARPASGVASLLLRRGRGAAVSTTGAPETTRAASTKSDGAANASSVARAALVGAAVVLAEGAEEFAGLASGNTLIGGLVLVSTVYTAAALPLLAPDLARWLVGPPWAMSLCALALALCGAGGFALFVAGFSAARSQQNALVMALRSHVMLMRRVGLVPQPE